MLWAARGLIDDGAEAVAPKAEQSLIESPETFGLSFRKRGFKYAQQTTKVLAMRCLSPNGWKKATSLNGTA